MVLKREFRTLSMSDGVVVSPWWSGKPTGVEITKESLEGHMKWLEEQPSIARAHYQQSIDWMNVPIIMESPSCRCELCGAVEETRPYGPKGEEVCFTCGMQDEEATKRGFERRFGLETRDE